MIKNWFQQLELVTQVIFFSKVKIYTHQHFLFPTTISVSLDFPHHSFLVWNSFLKIKNREHVKKYKSDMTKELKYAYRSI